MIEDLLHTLAYLKECEGKEGTKFQYLGKSVYDRISNISKDPNRVITHLHIPKGSKEKTLQLEANFKRIFGTDIDPELASFYTCFDGFEFRYVNPRKIWKEIDIEELDVDWDELGIEPDAVSYGDIDTEEYEEIKDAFYSLINLDDSQSKLKRLADPKNLNNFLFYNDSIEEEEYGIKTFIPNAEFLLSDENKIQHLEENMEMYLFNFHNSFNQVVLGKKNAIIGLYSAEDGQASISKSDELDIRLHLKKYLIR